MGENKIMEQITAVFSVFMVLFYLGIGWYFVFHFDQTYLDRPILVIIGSTFLFYGIYRAFKAYVQVKNAFFTKKQDTD